MDYDIIVVGSGLGGLTAASRLSVLGYKVGVFEQHYKAGGYASNFVREGYQFDVSLQGIPGLLEGGNLNRMLRYCQVLDKITPLKYEAAYSVFYQGETIVIPNDIIEYKELLLRKFPEEEEGIRRLFSDLGHFEEGFQRCVLGEHGVKGKLHRDSLLFIRWSHKTCYEVLKSYVKDDDLIRIFTALWPNFGVPPKKLSAIHFFITWVSYHYHGKYYIQGGAEQLTNGFLEVMKEHGVQMHYQANVVKLLNDGKRICGIELENGEVYKASWVISNVNPSASLQLFRQSYQKFLLGRKVQRKKTSCSLTKLYLGLDCSTDEADIPAEEVFICCGKNHEEDYNMSISNLYEKSGYLLTNYSSMDKTLNSEDKGVLTMTFIDNYNYWNVAEDQYQMKKAQVKEQMIERIIRDYPAIKGHIVVAELATPRTMERLTKNRQGTVYGYHRVVRRMQSLRYKSQISVPGLSFVGAWVSHGGYEGTITSAVAEAQRVHVMIKRKRCISRVAK